MLLLPSRYALASLGKQLSISDIVGDDDWNVDLTHGQISFGDRYCWHVQLLGTESESSGTWLWAWANTESNIPTHLLVASLALKAYGELHGHAELTTPQVPLAHVDGHTLALLASGVCEADAYYRCPYEGGAAFVLIKDENFPRCTEPPLARIASVFPQAIASLDIPDHRLAFTCYLEYYRLAFEEKGAEVVVKEGNEPVLTAAFDELNRLTKLEAMIKHRRES